MSYGELRVLRGHVLNKTRIHDVDSWDRQYNSSAAIFHARILPWAL